MNTCTTATSILTLLLQLVISTCVSSQTVFVKDTIWRSPTDKPGFLRLMKSYNDTTTIVAGDLRPGKDSSMIYTIAGSTGIVSELTYKGSSFRSSGPESTADVLWVQDLNDSQDVVMRTRNGKAEVVVDLGRGNSQGLPPGVTEDSRFYPLSNERILLLFYVGNLFVKFTPTFTNIDHDTRFQEIRLPDPPGGNSSYLQWALDYADTNTMYVVADGSDYFNRDIGPMPYYTPDMGNTYISIPGPPWDLPVGMGLFEPGFGIQTFRLGGNRNLGSIEFRHAVTGEVKPCPWRDNLMRTLFPWYDSTKTEVGFSFAWYHGIDVMYGIGLHPEAPSLIAIVVRVDTLMDSSWVSRRGLVLSTDSGTTWSWLEQPASDIHANPVEWVRIDPKTNSIVYSVSHRLSKTDDVIRVRLPGITGVAEKADNAGSHFELYPNPSVDRLYINFLTGSEWKTIDIYNSVGMLMYEHQVREEAAQNTQIDTHAWNNGMYVLKLTENTKVYYRRFIVSH